MKVLPFAKHYDYLTESFWGSRFLQYVQKVMVLRGKSTQFMPKSPLKTVNLQPCLPKCTDEGRELKCYHGVIIQRILQELGLCLFTINHSMVTGSGPQVTQPTPASWPQGQQLPWSVSPNKEGAASSHSRHYRGHTGLCQASPFILYHLQDRHHRPQASKTQKVVGEHIWVCSAGGGFNICATHARLM